MNVTLLNSVDPAALGNSALFTEFISNPARGLLPFLPGVDGRDDCWRAVIETSRNAFEAAGADAVKTVIDPLIDYNRRLGAGGVILEKLGRVPEGNVFFVVTGQQPGILGGALMVAYKIITAVTLAKHLQRRFSVECIPLYWCGSDDSDFQEIRAFSGFSAALSPASVSLPAEAHTGSQPVGSIPSPWSAKIWESASSVLDDHRSFAYVDEVVRNACSLASDHGEAAAALLLDLFGGEIAVVDGRAGFMKRSAQALYRDYFDREEEVKSLVRKEGDALRAAGYHAQLETGSDSGIFLLEEDSRRKVPPGSISLLDAAIRDRIETCSPGVILRTLIQDHLFRPLASVLGPAELAYRAQIRTLYPFFGITPPAPVPRLSATLIPPQAAGALERTGIQIDQFLRTPLHLFDALSDEVVPPEVRVARQKLAGDIAARIDDYLNRLKPHLPDQAYAKYRSQVSDGQRRLGKAVDQVDGAARQAAAAAWPWIKNIDSIVRPNGHAQERSTSLLMPFLFAGKDALMVLEELGDLFINDLLDGKPAHYVYSIHREATNDQGTP
jgi:hypothetical protein